MDTLLCLKCGHEFPAEGAKRKPDKTGLIIFGGMGGILLLFAVAAFAVALPYYWNTSDRTTVVYGGMLAVLAGLAGIGLGLALRKGMYAYCPACGLPRALPSASSSAKDFKRRQAKG